MSAIIRAICISFLMSNMLVYNEKEIQLHVPASTELFHKSTLNPNLNPPPPFYSSAREFPLLLLQREPRQLHQRTTYLQPISFRGGMPDLPQAPGTVQGALRDDVGQGDVQRSNNLDQHAQVSTEGDGQHAWGKRAVRRRFYRFLPLCALPSLPWFIPVQSTHLDICVEGRLCVNAEEFWSKHAVLGCACHAAKLHAHP
jgi:hypothetical protein